MPGSISLESRVVAAADQVSSDLGSETVILKMSDGMYYGLEGVGARVWAEIQEPRTVREVRDALLLEYEVDADRCEADLVELLTRLADRKLVEIPEGRA